MFGNHHNTGFSALIVLVNFAAAVSCYRYHGDDYQCGYLDRYFRQYLVYFYYWI
jgi:hypothetical protein